MFRLTNKDEKSVIAIIELSGDVLNEARGAYIKTIDSYLYEAREALINHYEEAQLLGRSDEKPIKVQKPEETDVELSGG